MQQQIINPVFDLSYLNELSGGDQEFRLEMIEIFVDEVPQEISLINQNLEEENWDGVKFYVHKLKSKIRIIGLHKIYEIAEDIEQRIKRGAGGELIVPDLKVLIETMNKALVKVKAELMV